MSEPCRLRRGEGYAACADEMPPESVLPLDGVGDEALRNRGNVKSVHSIPLSHSRAHGPPGFLVGLEFVMKPVQLRRLHALQQLGHAFVHPDIGHPRIQQGGEVLLTFGSQHFQFFHRDQKNGFL